jgi:hypothetical protein
VAEEPAPSQLEATAQRAVEPAQVSDLFSVMPNMKRSVLTERQPLLQKRRFGMEEELEKRLREVVREQERERLERMLDPRIEAHRRDPELQENLRRWREAISAELAKQEVLDGHEMINGPDSPRDLDHPFDGIPEEFLPSGPRGEAILKERERRLRQWDRDHPS